MQLLVWQWQAPLAKPLTCVAAGGGLCSLPSWLAPADMAVPHAACAGVTGAGRAAKEANLYCEIAEGMNSYAVGKHRHMPEIEQGLTEASGTPVTVSFTPHLINMSRWVPAAPRARGHAMPCHAPPPPPRPLSAVHCLVPARMLTAQLALHWGCHALVVSRIPLATVVV